MIVPYSNDYELRMPPNLVREHRKDYHYPDQYQYLQVDLSLAVLQPRATPI